MDLGNMRRQGVTSSGRHNGQLRVSPSAPRVQFRRPQQRAAARQGSLRVAATGSSCINVGHRRDASLFNCLVLRARCHQAEHTRRRNARPAWEK
jgi:hypothetical protein